VRAAIYARVSTVDQEPENQLGELRRYVAARGWRAVEYVDRGVSGAKDRRPALDQLVANAKRRRVDVVVCWRLDRLGRSLKHLITLLEADFGVAFAPRSIACPKTLKQAAVDGVELDRSVYLYGVAGRERTAVASAVLKMLRAADWSRYAN